jgi:hypothetical protein
LFFFRLERSPSHLFKLFIGKITYNSSSNMHG